ncbi:MAG TPA: glycerophosphoryl diester phosphodiesterase membrane domain-containing protein [Pedococcus sp.]|uniref:glycerophosphoryl diester phosphodiesterase membrane domain-containing protein n=1 Tax=Pedococcus sp. TaxID=2860345 RepID=UPI002F938536
MSEGILPGRTPREAGAVSGNGSETSWTAPGSTPAPAGPPGAPPPGWPPPSPPPPGPAGPTPPAGPTGSLPGGPPAWQPAWASALTAHKPGIVALRPLSLGDIVEGGFASIRRNPRTFLGLAVLTALAVLVVAGLLFLVGYLVSTALEGSTTLDVFLTFGITSFAVVMLFLSAATSIALSGMLAYPVGEAVLGRKPTIGETWRKTRRMLPRLIGLCAVLVLPTTALFALVVGGTIWAFAGDLPAVGVLGVLGVLAAGAAVLWLGVRLALATPALVLEDLRVIGSLRRSWGLTAGLFWRTFGILTVSSLLIGVVQYLLSMVLQIGGMLLGLALGTMLDSGSDSDTLVGVVAAASSVVGGLVSGMVTQPFLAAVAALLYTDSRIRKEGFDLALARAVADAGRSPAR